MNDRAPTDLRSPWSAEIYAELRKVAAHYLRRERSDHTLQPTALVHETYLQLRNQRQVDWRNRGQFVGVAACLMRRVLREYARARSAGKRSGRPIRIMLEDDLQIAGKQDLDCMELEEALASLTALDPTLTRVVELRFFGGLTIDETADLLALSPATVKRHWTVARAFLYRHLSAGTGAADQ